MPGNVDESWAKPGEGKPFVLLPANSEDELGARQSIVTA